MDNRLNRLRDLLIEEIGVHEALKQDLQTEFDQDGTMNGATLLRLQGEKNQRVREIRALESQRIDLVEELAATWQQPASDLTLRNIIKQASQETAASLEECHRRLVELVEEIRNLARQASQNAQARLKAIDATLAVIGEAVKMHPTYSEEGRLQKVTPTFRETSV